MKRVLGAQPQVGGQKGEAFLKLKHFYFLKV